MNTVLVVNAEAIAIEEKVRAYGGPQFQVTQQVMNRFAQAIEHAGVDVVPRIVVGGGNGNGSSRGSSLMEGLVGMPLSDRMETTVNGSTARPEAAAMREQRRHSACERGTIAGRSNRIWRSPVIYPARSPHRS
jgi:hypothetical protein